MGFRFHCPGVGGRCGFELMGPTVATLWPGIREHLRDAHGLVHVPKAVLLTVEGGIIRTDDSPTSGRSAPGASRAM